MTNQTTFTKSKVQTDLEALTKEILERNLTTGIMIAVHNYLKGNTCNLVNFTEDEMHSIESLYTAFKSTISFAIIDITKEVRVRTSIVSLAKTCGCYYSPTSREYDTFSIIVSDTFISLYDVISKGPNKGLLRLDTLIGDPYLLYMRLRYHITQHMIIDRVRKFNTERKHVVSDTTSSTYIKKGEEKNYSGPKADCPEFNSRILQNDVESQHISTFPSEMKCRLILPALKRYATQNKNRVAAYLCCKTFLDEYNKNTIIHELTTGDFDKMFKELLEDLEVTFYLDLSAYKGNSTNTKWLDSFKAADEAVQRRRIDTMYSKAFLTVMDTEEVQGMTKELEKLGFLKK